MYRVCANCGIKFVGITCHACGKNNNYRAEIGKINANQMATSIIGDFNRFANQLIILIILIILVSFILMFFSIVF